MAETLGMHIQLLHTVAESFVSTKTGKDYQNVIPNGHKHTFLEQHGCSVYVFWAPLRGCFLPMHGGKMDKTVKSWT